MSYLVEGNSTRVDAWSSQRLKFEPKGWQRDFRRDLREAICLLRPPAKQILSATYSSEVRDLVDVENVLLYNVGTGCFAAAAAEGLRVERSFRPPPAPPAAAPEASAHHHSYRFETPGAPWSGWAEGQLLARLDRISSPPLREETKASSLWWAIRSAAAIERLHAGVYEGPFALRVQVDCPHRVNFAAFVKPLVDGLVAALHSHDGNRMGEVAERVAQGLGREPGEVAELLSDEGLAVLGRRRLLWPWGQTVQWNPADDQAVAIEIVQGPAGGDEWAIQGELCELSPAGQARMPR